MSEALEALGINGPFLLSQIVNFLILFIALRFILWKPLMERLEDRREMLQQQREDADDAEQARMEIEQERQEVLEEARSKAREIVDEAEKRVETLEQQTLEEAQQEAERIIDEARQDAKEERNRILGESRGQVAALAMAAAQRIIGQELDEGRQRALVNSFFSGVREGKVEVLPEEMERPSDGRVTVTSAVPLTDSEKETIQEELVNRLSGEVELDFRVQPEILGGLIVQVGNRVIDGSAVGQLERLQESLA